LFDQISIISTYFISVTLTILFEFTSGVQALFDTTSINDFESQALISTQFVKSILNAHAENVPFATSLPAFSESLYNV